MRAGAEAAPAIPADPVDGGAPPEQLARNTQPALYSRSEDGHRLSFLSFFEQLLNGKRVAAGQLFGTRRPVLFLMIEEAFWLYVLVGLVRTAMGTRTVGFLFRPRQALEGTSLRLRTKRALLRSLKSLPLVTTLTIVPFSVAPRFAEIADGWIDDPQQWDLAEADFAEVARLRKGASGLAATIRAQARGRTVVSAIGRQDRDKGFDLFARTYSGTPDLSADFLFICGGRISADLTAERAGLERAGGFVVDRKVDDAELLEIYSASDLAWCCYATWYDQSSGIMGRAAQLGIPVVVRKGSLLEQICNLEGIAHVVLEGGLLAAPPLDPLGGRENAGRMRERSIATLATALGGANAP